MLALSATVGVSQTAGPVVGFYRLKLSPGIHLVSPPLAPLALESGRVADVARNQLAEANASWAPAQWAGHQIIFTSGAATGWRYWVTGNSAHALQVIPDPLSEGVVAPGDAYEVLPNLEEYFGDQLRGSDRLGVYDWENPGAEPVMLWPDTSGWWRAPDGAYAPVSVIAGQGFWLELAGDPAAVGQPRELVLTGRLTWPGGGVPVESGAQILSVPLPAQWDVNLVNWTPLGAAASDAPEQADQLGVYDETSGTLRWAWLTSAGWQWISSADSSSPIPPFADSPFRFVPGQACVYVHRGHGFFLNWSVLP